MAIDYIITQRIIPIIKDIVEVEGKNLGESLFYLKTCTNIDLLKEFCEIKYQFQDLRRNSKREQIFENLLKIGHLKELGRANLNMNLNMRANRATFEYNYHDPKGRASRFANAERNHENFKEIKQCPCCGENSMVLYRITTEDIFFNKGSFMNIDWVKCYMCDYHLRYNVGNPSYFNLAKESIFT